MTLLKRQKIKVFFLSLIINKELIKNRSLETHRQIIYLAKDLGIQKNLSQFST